MDAERAALMVRPLMGISCDCFPLSKVGVVSFLMCNAQGAGCVALVLLLCWCWVHTHYIAASRAAVVFESRGIEYKQ